ncbi:hypothetical protein PUNSTDRAFT_134772 [Punctularia strigosozonata HHB-11173 SS5]|uniref:uncharacterized protein n=1 Tax=Punctularia strigosozonata (strain HHB-11173) TaxID=741275 RepID=UPI000441839D|nr:uncharacterized protein PUNSTDRAFT_134772 [Punctularia strigosozonata HHB-11173 SS5]EIN08386.1 hypothetical protein PUNSTDRAFT_134772 [Punctularia strigosozonata HHB-11173 SS5]
MNPIIDPYSGSYTSPSVMQMPTPQHYPNQSSDHSGTSASNLPAEYFARGGFSEEGHVVHRRASRGRFSWLLFWRRKKSQHIAAIPKGPPKVNVAGPKPPRPPPKRFFS